jgi:serine/threonine-protein kinase HipA
LQCGESPKLSSPLFEGLAFDEFFYMHLPGPSVSRCLGWIWWTWGVKALLIQRYDREVDRAGRIVRVHYEDFCQALGIMPDRKHEADGAPDSPR